MELLGHQIAVHTELLRFLGSIALGLPVGLWLDCFRTLRALVPHHWTAVFVEDALFAFGAVFLLQCYVWMYADGQLRWQYAAGGLLGTVCYLLTAGALWMRVLSPVRRLYARIGRGLRSRMDGAAKKIHEKTKKNAENT